MRKLLFVVVAAALAVPAFAASDSPSEQAQKPKKEKKICRSQRETGSRVSTTTCLTEQEWRDRDANGQDALGGRSKAFSDIKGTLRTGSAPQ